MRYKVVDLGCKLCGATTEFLSVGSQFFGRRAEGIRPSECLGLDLKAEYARPVRAQGYGFEAADVLADPSRVPEADFVLLWDFLEHLPTRRDADAVLALALDRAKVGVWARMPSFEADAAAALAAHGLRFTWSRWTGHPTHYLVDDAVRVVRGHPKSWSYKVKPGVRIDHTSDTRVVPESAPVDTVHYDKKFGPKPLAYLDPPLVIQWEVIVHTGPE